jgi:hypothetical protein
MKFRGSIKCRIAFMAVLCVLAVSTMAEAQIGAGEDLLNPNLDQPLAQYESTGVVPFEPVVEAKPIPKVQTQPAPPRLDLSSPNQSTNRLQLAPNPLADPGALTPESSNPIKNQPKTPWATEKPANNSIETLNANPPQPKLTSPDLKPLPKKEPAKPQPPKKKPEKKKTKSPKKKPSYTPKQPVVNFNIYREASPWPIDPRKPNNPCTQQSGCQCGFCASTRTGLRGRPYQPTEPGGCQCGKRCPNKHPQFSSYWPRPFSAKLDERDPERAAARYSGCQKPKLNDMFDRFTNFRLLDYDRTDNGYCGPERDPYGCLGESKAVGVVGVGFRAQSVPVAPAGVYPLR